MIRKNKIVLIISSIVILLPMLFVFFGEKILPDEIAVHWGMNGEADGWLSSSIAFIIIPAVLLAVQWICIIVTAFIDKGREQNEKIMRIVYWIIPFISLVSCGMIFLAAIGYTPDIYVLILLVIAVPFMVIGNYLPKTTRNCTMGIKIKWTLSNDENWRATHRFSGKLFVALGILCLPAMLLPPSAFPFVALALILSCALLPVVYSYRFYKKQLSDGTATKEDYEKGYGDLVKNKKASIIITIIMVLLLTVFVSVVMFTGKIEMTLGDSALTVRASFSKEFTLKYEDIESVEYRENGTDGMRVYGFSSARLSLGMFKNEEFGMYTRYTYTGDIPCIVLKTADGIVVLGADDEPSTKEIYSALSSKIAE